MSELAKLRKVLKKLERRHDKVGILEQARIMRKAIKVETKIRRLTRRPHEKGT